MIPECKSKHRPSATKPSFSVEDQGIGLGDEERADLLQAFLRVDRQEVGGVGGTGLGLYITRNLVHLQGGRIWVESEPGKGTTFSIALPIRKQEQTG